MCVGTLTFLRFQRNVVLVVEQRIQHGDGVPGADAHHVRTVHDADRHQHVAAPDHHIARQRVLCRTLAARPPPPLPERKLDHCLKLRLIQHLDSSALGLVRRWLLIGYFPIHVLPPTRVTTTSHTRLQEVPLVAVLSEGYSKFGIS
jgi:hypothetical protein